MSNSREWQTRQAPPRLYATSKARQDWQNRRLDMIQKLMQTDNEFKILFRTKNAEE